MSFCYMTRRMIYSVKCGRVILRVGWVRRHVPQWLMGHGSWGVLACEVDHLRNTTWLGISLNREKYHHKVNILCVWIKHYNFVLKYLFAPFNHTRLWISKQQKFLFSIPNHQKLELEIHLSHRTEMTFWPFCVKHHLRQWNTKLLVEV